MKFVRSQLGGAGCCRKKQKRMGVIPAFLAHSNGGQASSAGSCNHLELKSSLALLSDGYLFDKRQATDSLKTL